ncbi:right-handed parallel beta-helix repeat-containing protein [Tahibacter sp.]|uniref:right-handed parallel beta-helix repeat-containing protein n=1 Tax=Tahibacter sp. TaxID=2056211 RepID=UPI0028C503D6|nr:right-handed parallel beta-helix repeat-containing protein [Tahibacter sp.]
MLTMLLALVFMLLGNAAHAIQLCVNSNATLDTAFSVAGISPDATTIRMATGTYQLGGRFANLARPTTLLGGYNADCSVRKPIVSAAETVIDLSGAGLTLQQNTTSDNLVAIDGLSIVNVNPLKIYTGTFGRQGAIQLSHTHIRGIPPSAGPGDLVAYGGGSITLDNVLIDQMASGMQIGTCAQGFNLVEGGALLVNNSTIDIAPNRQLCMSGSSDSGEGYASFANSILWSSVQTSEISSVFMSTINMINTTYFSLDRNGAGGTTVAPGQTNPQWVNAANGNYSLQSTSPAVNTGAVVFPGGLSSTDILGHTRWLGSFPDRGAFESAFNDATQYSVITTADTGVGSLRDAITQANASANPATITFNIPGNCPRVIALASTLPQITTPIVIDGTTQSGSSVNGDADSFDADLCVLVKPASGTLSYGFNVPTGATAGSLTLRGLGIGGFSQPVMLLGGSNHVIAGNQFGGSVTGIALPGASFSAISIGVNAGGSLIVGGNSLADRNVIGGAELAGINVASTVSSSVDRCQFVNNLIGVAANGTTALPNFTGINLAGSGCLVDRNRIVGNTRDAVWINGSSNHVVQRNRIGYTVNGSGFLSGAGVRVSGSNNTIGAPATSNVTGGLYANTIRNMLQGGVLVEGGTNNAVRTNLIYDNGASNNGMDIDLDASGPLANDAGDGDDGANRLQNFPTITALVLMPVASPSIDVNATVSATLDAAPGTYRIDAYFSPKCDNVSSAGGRPHAEAFIGTAQITLPASAGALKVNVVLPTISGNPLIGLTATDAAGNTSEIGTCFAMGNATYDKIFRDGFN